MRFAALRRADGFVICRRAGGDGLDRLPSARFGPPHLPSLTCLIAPIVPPILCLWNVLELFWDRQPCQCATRR